MNILDASFSTTLDGAGNGTVRVGPERARERWHVRNIGVRTSTNASEAVVEVYLQGSTLLGATYTGSRDNSTMDVELGPQEFINVEFRDGDAGAIASVYVYGERSRT